MTQPRPTPQRALRDYLAGDEILILPGAFDAISARLIESCGFAAVYATGAGFANAGFAVPDVGLVTASEVVTHVGRMTESVNIPVVVDADTGYGDVLQVRRTVRELERMGAAAIQLEDQVEPKRCGHLDGQRVIGIREMVQKIAIACDTRRDPDLVIIARTDARSAEGFDAAVERGRRYAAAGADLVFVEAPFTREEVFALPKLIDAPLIANVVEGGKTPTMSAAQLQAAGYKVALFANSALRASLFAVQSAMRVLRSQGHTESLADSILSWADRQQLVHLDEMQALEARYAANATSGEIPAQSLVNPDSGPDGLLARTG